MFPNKRIPHRSVFARIDRKLREFGHLNVSSIDMGKPRLDNGEFDKQGLDLVRFTQKCQTDRSTSPSFKRHSLENFELRTNASISLCTNAELTPGRLPTTI
jgi:hypothetical protein